MLKNRMRSFFHRLRDLEQRTERIQEALGRIEGRQLQNMPISDLRSAEFRVFSQWGEDGIIQRLLQIVEPQSKKFVEFGVQNYTESCTRFLLKNNNWSGLVIDGSEENVNYIKNDPVSWQYDLSAVCKFIDKSNIDSIISDAGFAGDIGLLSIDIDGNDYWIWENIKSVTPAIVIAEYNARFGPNATVTVPYRDDFSRTSAHYSGIYYGASLAALHILALKKGYCLVGCNSAGNNAFFVRRDLMTSPLRDLSPAVAFVDNKFRESRTPAGQLAFLTHQEERMLLDKLVLVDVGQR